MIPFTVEEQVLLRAAVASKANVCERIRALQQFDHSQSRAHLRYYPAIYLNCCELGVDSELPSCFRKAYLETWSRNRLLLLRARAVADYLAHREISTVFLKSAALMLSYGAPAGLRYMSDIDLMVTPEAFSQAIALLKEGGWRPSRPETFTNDLRNNHSVDLIDSNGHRLDLHVRGQVWASHAFDSELWGNACVLEQRGVGMQFVPSIQELFLSICSHGGLGHPEEMYWAIDAYFMLKKHGRSIDWNRQSALLKVCRMRFYAERALIFLADELNAPIPLSFIAPIRSRQMGILEYMLSQQAYKGSTEIGLRARIRLVLLRFYFSSFSDQNGFFLTRFIRFLSARWDNVGFIKVSSVLTQKVVRKVLIKRGVFAIRKGSA